MSNTSPSVATSHLTLLACPACDRVQVPETLQQVLADRELPRAVEQRLYDVVRRSSKLRSRREWLAVACVIKASLMWGAPPALVAVSA